MNEIISNRKLMQEAILICEIQIKEYNEVLLYLLQYL